jgi:hypothetical protein
MWKKFNKIFNKVPRFAWHVGEVPISHGTTFALKYQTSPEPATKPEGHRSARHGRRVIAPSSKTQKRVGQLCNLEWSVLTTVDNSLALVTGLVLSRSLLPQSNCLNSPQIKGVIMARVLAGTSGEFLLFSVLPPGRL